MAKKASNAIVGYEIELWRMADTLRGSMKRSYSNLGQIGNSMQPAVKFPRP